MKREKSLVLRLSVVERAGLDRLAEEWGTPRADIVRWGLRLVLKENPRQTTEQEPTL